MAINKVVFLFDVDNTLLNNNRVATDRARGMDAHVTETRGIMNMQEER